jgi:probable HAF family extracellular repeat protein
VKLIIGFFLGVFLFLSTVARGTEIYAITPISSSGTGMTQPIAMNDSSVVAGINGSLGVDYWQNGVVKNLPVASGYSTTERGCGINSSGQIVGSEENENFGTWEGVVWQNGAVIAQINGTPNDATNLYSINNSGQISGTVGNNIYLWQLGSGTYSSSQNLGLPSGATDEFPFAINNNGEIAGFGSQPFIWKSTTGFQILPGGSQSQVYSVNDSGQVVGADGSQHAILWQPNGGTMALGTLGNPTDPSIAYGINNQGQAVGGASLGPSGTNSGGYRAFIWQASTGIVDLNTLISPSSGWTLEEATGINNHGQIIGFGTGPGVSFILTPPVLSLSASGTLQFGTVLVGTTGSMTISASNIGPAGSSFGGGFQAANSPFAGAAVSFGTLGSGNSSSDTYSFIPSGRGATSQAITIASDLGNSTLTLAGTGVAPVESISTTTAYVRIGTTGSAAVSVTNIGDGNLSGTGTNSNLNGTIASSSGAFIGPGATLSLADSAMQTALYAYQPTGRLTASATVVAQFSDGSSDGTNHPQTVNVAIRAQGVGPTFQSSVTPNSTLNFGSLGQGMTGSIGIQFSNSSLDPDGGNSALTDLTLSDIRITGPDAGLFELIGHSPGILLQESGSASFDVEFLGSDADGVRSAMLTVSTDEGAALGASGNSYSFSLATTVVPEPSTFKLAICAAIVTFIVCRRGGSGKVGFRWAPF